MSPKSLKFPPFAAFAVILSLTAAAFVFPAQGVARDAATDPNLIQRVEQFIDKPAPQDLLLKPKHKHKKHVHAKD